ncbi:unnamed protein product, partial [Brassica rapa]
LQSSLGSRPSYAWRSILHGRELLSKGLIRDIGNGRSSNVWHVNWIIDPIPRTPNYRQDSVIDLTLTISDLLLPNSSAWDAALVRRTFTDHDAEIILRLKPNRMQEDGYKWGFTKDGIYTSRSGYRFVDSLPEEDGSISTSLPPLEKYLWKSLWKIRAPPKIKHFLWKALSGALAVMERLRSRGIQVDSACKVCNGGIESICHLLFSCPMAKDTWERSSIKLPVAGLYHLLEMSRKSPKDSDTMFFPWILWHLWKARNGLAFEKIHYSSVSVLSKARAEAAVWFELNTAQTEEVQHSGNGTASIVAWSKPPLGYLKCNIGVSWLNAQTNCGVAWILRDNKGKPILHSRRSFTNVETKREAELMAIHWAVSDMTNTRQQRILFESNCALAKETFLNPSGFYQHQHIMYETSARLRHLQDWSFHHCVQERNIVAQEVVQSVTNDHRYHSYIAAGGPSWLQHSIAREARM